MFIYQVVFNRHVHLLALAAATRSDENERNRARVNTKLFGPSLGLPYKPEDTPKVPSDGKDIMLLFCY